MAAIMMEVEMACVDRRPVDKEAVNDNNAQSALSQCQNDDVSL